MIIFRDDSTFVFIINNIYMKRKNLHSNTCTHMYLYTSIISMTHKDDKHKLMLSSQVVHCMCYTKYSITLLEKSTVYTAELNCISEPGNFLPF